MSEPLATPEAGTMHDSVTRSLEHIDDEVAGVVVHQIPGVRVELVADLSDEAGRTVHPHARVATEANAQQMIESCEVIHVRVTHEHVAHSQQNPRGQRGHIADVEQQRAALVFQIDTHTGIAPHAIHQRRAVDGLHARTGRSSAGYLFRARGIAHHGAAGCDISCHDAARANDRVVAHDNPRQQDRATADPDIAPNADGPPELEGPCLRGSGSRG